MGLRELFLRCPSLALGCFVALGVSGGSAAELIIPGADSPAPAPAVLPDLAFVATDSVDLGVARDRALAVADLFPGADYNIGALAETFGGDPLAAFAYVRDRIGFDPYDGVLRGAAGALAARAGNSADQGLLLAALLDALNVETRFVAGSVDAAGLARLRAAALTGRDPGPAETAALAGLAGLSPAALDRLAARARRDFAWLWPAVGGHLSAPARAIGPPSPRHIWVQARIGGAWIDLDPTLPDAEPGAALARGAPIGDILPDSLDHRVTIAVVAEAVVDGNLQLNLVLEARFSAVAAQSDQIFLAFQPEAGGGFGGIGASVAQAAGARARFVPMLVASGDVVRGAGMPPLPGADNEAMEFFFGGESDGGFGGGLGGDPGTAGETTDGELTAVYLDVTMHRPGRPAQSHRRVLLDRVPADRRLAGATDAAGLQPMAPGLGAPAALEAIHQIVISTGAADPHGTAVDVAVALEALSGPFASEAAMAELPLAALLWPIGAVNQTMVLASERLALGAANGLRDARLYVAEPRVYVLSFGPAEFAEGAGVRFAIDLLHDPLAAVAADGVAATAIAQRRLWYGVVQSALETTLAELRAGGSGLAAEPAISTSIAMSSDLAAMTAMDDEILAAGTPAALRAALAADLIVVAAASPVGAATATWWTVDPSDGATRAVLDPGLGGAGGGRWIPPGRNGVNAAPPGGDRLIVDPRTGNETGFSRNGRDYSYRRRPPAGRCSGPNEYQTILGCVSLPAGMTLGWAYTLVVGEIVAFATLTIALSL